MCQTWLKSIPPVLRCMEEESIPAVTATAVRPDPGTVKWDLWVMVSGQRGVKTSLGQALLLCLGSTHVKSPEEL